MAGSWATVWRQSRILRRYGEWGRSPLEEETFPLHERPWVNITSREKGRRKLGEVTGLVKVENWICKLNELCPGNYLNIFIRFLMTVLIHCNLDERLSNYFWVIITRGSMTRIPGNNLVTEALIQQIFYLHFAGSGLTSSFLINHPCLSWLCTGSLSPLSTSEELFPSSQESENIIDPLLHITL